MRSAEARMLSAELRGDERQWRRLRTEPARGWWLDVMPVACTVAARRRFGRYTDRRIVTHFATRFVELSPDGARFTARDVDAVIRGITGEDSLLLPLEPELVNRIMYAALFALVDDLQLDDKAVDALLAEAENEIAAAHAAMPTPPPAPDVPPVELGLHQRTHRRYLGDDDHWPQRLPELRPPRELAGIDGFGEVVVPPLDHTGRAQKDRQRGSGQLPSSRAGRSVRASLLRDQAEQNRIGEVANADLLRVTRSAFSVALRRYLHPDPDVREIAALVALTRNVFHADLDPMKAEYIARAAMGEQVPLDGLTSKDVYLACSLMLGTIVDWWHQDAPTVNAVIVEAEEAVSESGYVLVRAGA